MLLRTLTYVLTQCRRNPGSYKETHELESLPARIQALEDEQHAITEQLADADLYRSQAEKVARLRERFAEIEEELMTGLARWEALEARQVECGLIASA